MHKRYQVVFTGKYTPGTDKSAVVSNIVLFGVAEEKARVLVTRDRAVLKRFALAADAQKMVSKLERAGLACVIEEAEPEMAEATAGESTLVSLFSRLSPLGRK
jgi:hypothetical protein